MRRRRTSPSATRRGRRTATASRSHVDRGDGFESDDRSGQGRSASLGDVHARRRAVAVVDARWPTGVRASRRRSGRPAGRSVAAVGSLRDRAGRGVRNLAGAASPDRNHRQRNVAARLARWPARRLRLRSRFDRRRGSMGDAGAGGIGREAGAAWRPAAAASSGCRRRRAIRHSGRREPAAARRSRHARARRRARAVVGAGQPARRLLRGARRAWLGVGGQRRTAIARAERQGIDCPASTGGAASAGVEAWRSAGVVTRWPHAARRRPRPSRSRSTTATRCAVRPSRRRSFRCRARFSCGGSRRRRRCTKTAARSSTELAPSSGLLTATFARTWQTLRDLYYSGRRGRGCVASARRKVSRPRAVAARTEAEFEAIVDEMIAEQPLIKPVVTSNGAVVVSGHPLASEAGRLALERGGNIVDAMVAVSFALGVVEPEASGIGGDGAAVLYLKGMKQPTVIDYKDQTPIRATTDNPAIMVDGRLIADGPAAANIPGVVAGLDHLYKKYGSGKVKWAELIEPAIRLADEGFVLDEALPTTIAEGRGYLEKYAEASRIYLPGRQDPSPWRSLRQQGLRRHAARHRQGRRRHVLSRRDRAQDRRRSRRPGRHHHLRRPRAVPRHRTRTGCRTVSRPRALRRRPSGRDRHPDVRVAADSRELPAAAGRAGDDRSRLFPLPDRIVEGARSDSPRRRPRTVAGGLRRAPDRRAREEALCRHRSAEGVAARTADAGRCAGGAATAHRHGDDVVCRRRCRRQHDRRHADAQHLGRNVLRVEGAGFPLQQPPAIVADDGGRLRQHGAADAVEHGQRADPGVCENAQREKCRGSRSGAPATRGSRCRSTT